MYPYFHIHLDIPAYGCFMAIGLLSACALSLVRMKRAGGNPLDFLIIASTAFGCGIFFAHFLFLLASYGVDQMIEDIKSGNWAFLTSGGLVFYGGLIGGIGGFFLGSGIAKESRYEMLCNAIVPTIPLGHAFGRIGCLFGGCCYGLPYDGFCAVHLPGAGFSYTVFPIQLVESLLNFLLCGALTFISRRNPRKFTLLYLYLLAYSAIRFVLEFFRGDLIRGVSAGLSTSQWISIVLFVVACVLLFLQNRKEDPAE